jgi:hypothetical protein
MMLKNQSITASFMTASVAKKKGGGRTRKRMHSTFNQFERIAKAGRWGHVTPASLTHKQAKNYVAERIKEGIDARSIQSEVSAIRRAMEGAGRHLDVIHLFTSESLGVPPAPRSGTGIAISIETYEGALASADEATAALMRLQLNLGLRLNEAIECKDSLKDWEEALRSGASSIHLTDGSKGGLDRDITILAQNFSAAYAAIVAALAVTNGGKNFPIAASNGETAARIYSRNLAKLGIKGEESSHSMRRRFACNQYTWYRENGLDKKAALSCLSLDLGHGDRRGRWVWNNYLKNSIQEDGNEAA